ncbi:unnamed protein product [Ixodes hexagonus]
MDAGEHAAVALTPAGFSKASTQCKLLETIFEDPKHGADGKERFTSVRKYKRFIDFTAGPTASKKWKRSQKARKLAVFRQSPSFQHQGHREAFECTQDISTKPTQRKTRTRTPTSTYHNGADYSSRDREQACYNGDTNGVYATADCMHTSSQSELGKQARCNNGSFQPDLSSGLPDTFIVSSRDLFVEEAATVELPLECASNGSASIDMEVRSSVEDLLAAVVGSDHSSASAYTSLRPDSVKHFKPCDGKAGVVSRDLNKFNGAQPTAEPRRVQMRVPTRKGPRKRASVWGPGHPVDRSVEGTVSELIAIIEATDTLCENVVENCGLSHCNVDSEIVSQLLHSFVKRVPENVP